MKIHDTLVQVKENLTSNHSTMSYKKIKILQTIRQGKIGGGESHVLDLVNELDKERYECVVLSFTQGPMVEILRAKGITTYVVETERPFDFTKWGEVKTILLKEKVDIVHAHGTRANSNSFYSAKELEIPVIYTVHGWSFHPDQSRLIRKLRIFSERFLVQQSRLTICVSENNLAYARGLFPLTRATVVKSGVNLNKFNSSFKFKDIRASLGIQKDTVLVGYVVRMTIQKDPLTLIKAISLIPKEMNIQFLFVGDGDLKADAIELAKELELQSKIIFMGFRQDVPDILNAIDIYCLPSLWEGLPIGMLEAMAMRKAVIVTNIDGAKEVVVHKKNGLLVPPKNPRELANALVLLSTNQELRSVISHAAVETISQDFNIQDATRRIEQVYESIITGVGIKS